MLAIPVFRSRVAPVLNWCSKIFIIPENETDKAAGREIVLYDMSGFDRLRALRERGVDTLICGALSPRLLHYGEYLGLRIIHGVAGEIDEVLRAYHEQQLDQPLFRIPGCQTRRHCHGKRNGLRDNTLESQIKRHRLPVESEEQNGADAASQKRESDRRCENGIPRGEAGTGQRGFCVCLQCGAKLPHERGIPCFQMHCPACGRPMGRE
jgi:predicted Fe-Mo cluster-binding NifX family protein